MTNTLKPYREQILQALIYAVLSHGNDKETGGESHINHLIEITYLLTCSAKVRDTDVIQAAILQEVLESVTIFELNSHFNLPVIDLLRQLNDLKSLNLEERSEFLKSTATANFKVIKLAELCTNVKRIPSDWELDRIKRYLERFEVIGELCRESHIELYGEFTRRLSLTKKIYLKKTMI